MVTRPWAGRAARIDCVLHSQQGAAFMCKDTPRPVKLLAPKTNPLRYAGGTGWRVLVLCCGHRLPVACRFWHQRPIH